MVVNLCIRSISESNNGNFMRAIDYLHRYFDKNLRFLSNKEKVGAALKNCNEREFCIIG